MTRREVAALFNTRDRVKGSGLAWDIQPRTEMQRDVTHMFENLVWPESSHVLWPQRTRPYDFHDSVHQALDDEMFEELWVRLQGTIPR